jgi:hypothetical protein
MIRGGERERQSEKSKEMDESESEKQNEWGFWTQLMWQITCPIVWPWVLTMLICRNPVFDHTALKITVSSLSPFPSRASPAKVKCHFISSMFTRLYFELHVAEYQHSDMCNAHCKWQVQRLAGKRLS